MAQPTKNDNLQFDIETLGKTPINIEWKATKYELKEISQRLKLESTPSFQCNFKIRRLPNTERIEVEGSIKATCTQICSISLKAFETKITEDFKSLFDTKEEPEPKTTAEKQDISANDNKWHSPEIAEMLYGNIIADTDDRPEILESNIIDLKDLAIQYLSLALPQYPRSPNAKLDEKYTSNNTDKASPFASLKDLLDE